MESEEPEWINEIRTKFEQPKRKSLNLVEVYADNFIPEIKRLSSYIEEYNFVGMDTEFPGVVYKVNSFSNDFYYKSIEKNVNKLKLIQLGISLFNSQGENPPECSTWQFNFLFDKNVDQYSPDSLALLISSGINFDKLKSQGIPSKLFGEYLMTSGLLFDPSIHWVTYHGSSDFAYLLKILLGKDLPASEKKFMQDLQIYFPSLFDIRVMIKGKEKEKLKGGLNKMTQNLNITRVGDVHQAGSDSLLTADTFLTLIKNGIVTAEQVQTSENILFGIGYNEDNEELLAYTKFGFDNGNEIDANRKSNLINSIGQQTKLNVNTPMFIPSSGNFKNKNKNKSKTEPRKT